MLVEGCSSLLHWRLRIREMSIVYIELGVN